MRYILHYTEPGDLIYDGFCGTGMTGVAAKLCGNPDLEFQRSVEVQDKGVKWGSRNAILGDISPAATFIAHNYVHPVNPDIFEKQCNSIMTEFEKELGWMYKTKHIFNEGELSLENLDANINYIVWSDVFICPHCGKELIFTEVANDKSNGSVKGDFDCDGCGVVLKKTGCKRAMEYYFDVKLQSEYLIAKQVPVLINYSYLGKKYEKKPDENDLKLIEKINSLEIPYWYPTDELPAGSNTDQPRNSHGVQRIHQFYTHRNLYAISFLYNCISIADLEYRDALLFTFEQILVGMSKLARYVPTHFSQVNQNLSGTLYIGSQVVEGKVRALIWKEAPTCSFNRIYARNEGYVLTVVPSKQKEFKSNTISVSCSRTIISLNPQARDQSGMAYSLLPVARLLETFEQEREADILHNSSNVKRDHSAPRGYQHQEDSIFIKSPFSETSDPWYINAEENLIASPHSGSLLSVEDIICVVCSFGDCTIRSSKTKVIVPFTYEQKIEKDLDRYLRSIGIKMDGHKNFPYVDSSKRYLNELLEEFILDDTNFSYYQIKTDVREMECLLFSYGVGFFFYNVNRDYVKQSRSSYTEIEEINESRFSLDHNIHNNELQFLGIQYPKLRFINPHFYTSVCLAPENIKISNKPIENFAKRLSTIDGSSSDRCITMEPTYRQALALSRVGCAYVSSVTIQDDLEKRYENEWFFLYLLVLQQRYMLMDCKRQLIAIKLTAGSKVKDLKEMLIAFCSNGLFSSAVEDELGDHYYRVLMEDVFYISSLKEEVLTQVEQLDHYHEGRLNETLNKISVWILPFMVISTILQCSIITMNPLISISDSGFPFRVTSSLQAWCSWGFIFLIIVIAFLILHLSRRRKK